MIYAYTCVNCGIIEVEAAADSFVCLTCGAVAKRLRSFAIDKPSLKSHDRWDPVVGQYVRNEAEFRSLLHAGVERESAELNMDVKLVEVDSRDNEALNELRFMSASDREADLEPTKKKAYDDATA